MVNYYKCRTLTPGAFFRMALVYACVVFRSAAAQAGDVAITQQGLEFTPTEVVLNQGDVLVFTNSDPTTHNIQVVNADGDAEDKGLQRPGTIVRHTFSRSGTYQVRCTIHPDMLLTVTVK